VTRLSEPPSRRAGYAACLLYAAAVGVIWVAATVCWLAGFRLGLYAACALQVLLVIHIFRRAFIV